jgi:hypothetical protein
MGQATIDLPDPTQLSGVDAGPLSPQALASADDLLSQLAGDDIDRLLAEADADRPPLAVPSTAPVAEPPPPAPAATIETVEATAPASPSLDAAASAAATAAALDAILAPAIESSLKAVEEQVNAVSQTIESATAPATPGATLPVDPAAAPVGIPAVEPSFDVLDQKLLNEAAAHVASIMDVPIALAPGSTEPATPGQAAETAERQALVVPHVEKKPSRIVSLLVRILEVLNSPMAFLPDEVRDAIGKVAILTTCNAVAVIVYVLVFRRPHH